FVVRVILALHTVEENNRKCGEGESPEMSRLSQGAQRPEVSQSQGNRDAFPERRDQRRENPWASVSAKKRGCVSRLLTRRFACSASTVTRIPESRTSSRSSKSASAPCSGIFQARMAWRGRFDDRVSAVSGGS